MRLYRHPDGDNVAKPECAIEYSLLEMADLLGDPAAAEIQERRDIHKATIVTRDQDEREMEKGDRTGQRALLAHGMREDSDKERTTLKRRMQTPKGGRREGTPDPAERAYCT